ncbi:MAG: hypothetical protein ACTSX7_04500, partial [Alphaproteobacteria bacterium]
DRLQALSKQGVVKATIIMPVVGYLILFNARLQPVLGLSPDYVFAPHGFLSEARLYLIYFGLASMGAASLWFQIRCPPVIKAHGSAHEFITREGNSLTEYQVNEMAKATINFEFGTEVNRWGTTVNAAINLDSETEKQSLVYTCVGPPHDSDKILELRNLIDTARRDFRNYIKARNRHELMNVTCDVLPNLSSFIS